MSVVPLVVLNELCPKDSEGNRDPVKLKLVARADGLGFADGLKTGRAGQPGPAVASSAAKARK